MFLWWFWVLVGVLTRFCSLAILVLFAVVWRNAVCGRVVGFGFPVLCGYCGLVKRGVVWYAVVLFVYWLVVFMPSALVAYCVFPDRFRGWLLILWCGFGLRFSLWLVTCGGCW